MTKIYTKGGDKGSTGLFSGERVSKSHALIEALGSVDELNSAIGMTRCLLGQGLKGDNRTLAYIDDEPEMLKYAKQYFDSEANLEEIEQEWKASRDSRRERAAKMVEEGGRLDSMLHTIQLELFELGAELASGAPGAGRISDAQVERFEGWIDELTAGLPELKNFILPTGHPVAAHLHVARTVSRRAERQIVAARETLAAAGEVRFDDVVIRYMNRLNDLLFVLAREANRVFGVKDEEWHSPR